MKNPLEKTIFCRDECSPYMQAPVYHTRWLGPKQNTGNIYLRVDDMRCISSDGLHNIRTGGSKIPKILQTFMDGSLSSHDSNTFQVRK